MGTVRNFEELNIWKKARILCISIYRITKILPLAKDSSLINQMIRSSGSVMDNIAEGFEPGGKKEFIQFLYITKGSTGEVRSQLYRVSDNHLNSKEINAMITEVEELGKMIGGFIKYLKKSEFKGHKFKEPEIIYYS